MRIISGEWGGQGIPGKASPKLRPTSDKVKESIFDQLEARWITDWSSVEVLDLFAGLGSLGLEALSRGAKRAVFVDHHLMTARQLTQTVQSFGAENRTEVLCKGALDALRWLAQRDQQFNLIFLDPPYREDWISAVLNSLQTHHVLARKGLIIAEHDKRENFASTQALWKEENSRRFGDSQVTILSANEM